MAQGSIREAEELFRVGDYVKCVELADAEIESRAWSETWRHLKLKAELAQGNYAEAMAAAETALKEYPTSVPIKLLAHEAFLYNGQADKANETLLEIDALVFNDARRFTTAESRVALGRFFLLRGADARKILEGFFDYAKERSPAYEETYFAMAELALAKDDFDLASSTLQSAPEEAAQDPRFHYLMARAFARTDPAIVLESLDAALAINPNHVDTLLLQVDKLIDAEQYDTAELLVEQVHEVNPHEPRAWAYKAVMAHLRSAEDEEATSRREALAHHATNPEVDWLIGRKLSQKYRFAEGEAYQRRALELNPDYLPAKIELCQNLLRLGEEEEGWALAQEIHALDAYNILIYNLVTLHDNISGFRTLAGDGFLLRMDAREADLYGQQALALLRRAKETLCAKYDVAVEEPVIVEIFPLQRDFAVRTFGIPGAEGYLGVCFGRVITANSPASQGENPSNWESVLWHEYCHVVTLNKTKNKMPRWLSEGISVYEELQEDPSWGQSLIPVYREMILGEDLTPMSELSSAFLSPKSALHLQFAYFESALAIEHIINEHGFETLVQVLDDLGQGQPLEVALPLRTGQDWEALDESFTEFARARVAVTAPEASWEQPELERGATAEDVAAWLEENPNSFPGLVLYSALLVREERYDEAKTPLQKMLELYPEYVGADNAYLTLAIVHRELGETEEEIAMLEELARRDSDATAAYSRLAELGDERRDSAMIARNAKRYLACNPLIPAPHRALAAAAEELGLLDDAIAALTALTILDDTDPSGLHFRLAQLQHEKQNYAQARLEVLRALEDAPRYREAHELLLKLALRLESPLVAPPGKAIDAEQDGQQSDDGQSNGGQSNGGLDRNHPLDHQPR